MTSSKSLDKLFRHRHLDREITILCVRWYVSYKPSYRDLVEINIGQTQGDPHCSRRLISAEICLGARAA